MIALVAAIAVAGAGGSGDLYDVSAYCPCTICCGPNARGITASGRRVEVGMCAAPRSVPFGTNYRIPGYGVANVQDRGGAIKRSGDRYLGKRLRYDRIDLYFPTHADALRWGRRLLRVSVVK